MKWLNLWSSYEVAWQYSPAVVSPRHDHSRALGRCGLQRTSPLMRVLPINRPTTSLVHGLVSSVPSSKSAALGVDRCFTLHQAEIDPQMPPHMRVLSFGDLNCLKHIGWNEQYIAQLI